MGACFEAAGDEGCGEEFFEVEGEGVLFQTEGLLDFGEGEVWVLAEQDENGLSGRVVQRCDEQTGFVGDGYFSMVRIGLGMPSRYKSIDT